MTHHICDVKESITESPVLELLIPSVYNPTPERLLSRAKKYQESDKIKAYAYIENGEYKGIAVFQIKDNTATILDIAVKPQYQGQGIGSKLIDFIFNQFEVNKVIAETDNDAIGFYKKYGFVITDTKIEFNAKRYVCVYKGTERQDILGRVRHRLTDS